jgi:hypothetical protein
MWICGAKWPNDVHLLFWNCSLSLACFDSFGLTFFFESNSSVFVSDVNLLLRRRQRLSQGMNSIH